MNLFKALPLFSLLFFANTACSETPSAVVGAVTPKSLTQFDLAAVTYSGKTMVFDEDEQKLVPTKQPCTLQLSLLEEEMANHFIVQIAETIHGETLPALELDLYYRDLDNKTFVTEPPASGNFVPNLIGMIVDAEDVDVNLLSKYEKDVSLVQSAHLKFDKSTDLNSLQIELDGVMKSGTKSLSSQNLNLLDQLQDATLRMQHIGHIDKLFCGAFQLDTETSLVTFDLEGGEHGEEGHSLEQEGHEHEGEAHSHDHEHDHD